MQTILFLLITAVLVAVLIKVLHGRQLKRDREIAEQTTPLPPLEIGREAESPIRESIGVAGEMKAGEGLHHSPSSWQEEVRQLREAGRFREAIRLCRKQYPKMLAFRQSLVTLRASLKTCGEEKSDAEDVLKDLYQTAVIGDLFKAGLQSNAAAENADIAGLLQTLEAMDYPYDELGYNNLSMLNKTDRRILVQSWGEPEKHSNINEFLERHLPDRDYGTPTGNLH